MDAQRALLDELMGAARDLTEEERKGFREVRWDDRDVCGPFLVRFCPHDLFVNTKSNLGPCSKIHDPKLKESFEKSSRHDAYAPRFEAELAQFCEKLVSDLDRKVKRGHERLAQEVEVSTPVIGEKSEQLAMLEEKIKKLLEQVEELGEAGKVDEAEALMRKVDVLNTQKSGLAQQTNDKMALIQDKKMELCEICGSFLFANDAAERMQSHITGKQHIGYGMVRDFLNEYKATMEKKREDERIAREREFEERQKLQEEHRRVETYERERSRERDRGRDRGHYRVENDRPLDQRGRRDGGRGSDYKYGYGRDEIIRHSDRERHRYRDSDEVGDRGKVRSRSRSPARHSYRGTY